jgi:undecaprenyl diphosphate synthase
LTQNPSHIAIIMDGNRRWAQLRGLDGVAGHDAGSSVLREISRAAVDYDTKWLTVFAFSAENWQRSASEVRGLLELIAHFIKVYSTEFLDSNVRLRVIGRRDNFSPYLQSLIANIEKRSSRNTGLNLTVALDYGGRQDIVDAVCKIGQEIERGLLKSSNISDDLVKSRLSTKILPPVDLLIRTGGEKRISNFLLWDIVYTELYFTKRFWPDFTPMDLAEAIREYRKRDRRYGGASTKASQLFVVNSEKS